jgi:oligopeptide transport system permease protein
MFKYVLKRIGLALITAFIILSLTFILIKLLPFPKPIGQTSTQFSYYETQVHQGYVYSFSTEHPELGEYLWKYTKDKNTTYYYQVPVMKQYFSWLENIVTKWDWGTSNVIKPNVSASVIIGERLQHSIKINILSVLFSVPIGIALGIWAALKKNKPTDHIISTLVMIFISVPSFVLITFLMLILCYRNQILPSQWPNPTATMQTKILGYILPVFCLSFGSICGYCRYTRAELCEVMSSDYLLLARTKGLTKKQAILRHALRNAMVPIVPSILAEFIGILGGSMILENLYGIPGIGRLFVTALNSKDYNVLFVDMAIFTTLGLVAGVILDISYGFVDPRIRMGAKK